MQHKTVGMELVGTANALRRALLKMYGVIFAATAPPACSSGFFCMYLSMMTAKCTRKTWNPCFRSGVPPRQRILKSMERKGLILRVPSALDRRSKRIHLTAKACGICEENRRKLVAAEAMMCRGFDA